MKMSFLLASGLTVLHAIPFFPIRIVPHSLAPLVPGAYCLEAGNFEVGRKRRRGKSKRFSSHLFPTPQWECRSWVAILETALKPLGLVSPFLARNESLAGVNSSEWRLHKQGSIATMLMTIYPKGLLLG